MGLFSCFSPPAVQGQDKHRGSASQQNSRNDRSEQLSKVQQLPLRDEGQQNHNAHQEQLTTSRAAIPEDQPAVTPPKEEKEASSPAPGNAVQSADAECVPPGSPSQPEEQKQPAVSLVNEELAVLPSKQDLANPSGEEEPPFTQREQQDSAVPLPTEEPVLVSSKEEVPSASVEEDVKEHAESSTAPAHHPLETRCQELEAELTELKATTQGSLADAFVQLQESATHLQAALAAADVAKSEAQASAQQATELQGKLKEASNLLQASQEEANATQENLQGALSQIQQLEGAVQDLDLKAAELKAQLTQATEQHMRLLAMETAATGTAVRERNAALQRAEAADRALVALKKASAVEMDLAVTAREQLLNAQLEATKKEWKEANTQLMEMEEAKQRLAKQLERTEVEKNSLQEAYSTAFDDGQDLRAANLHLEAQVSELQAALNSTQSQSIAAADAAEHLSTAEAGLKQVLDQSSVLEQKVEKLAEENQWLAEQLKQQAQASQSAAAEAKQKQEALLLQLRDQTATADIQQKLDALITSHQELHQKLQAAEEHARQTEMAREVVEGEVTTLRSTLQSHLLMNETTATQTSALLKDYQLLKDKHAGLMNEMRMKDEMLELLQHQLSEVADLDVDSLLNMGPVKKLGVSAGSNGAGTGSSMVAEVVSPVG